MKRSMSIVVGLVAVLLVAGVGSADQFWGSASSDESANSSTAHDPVLFKLDTFTGTVGTVYTFPGWRSILDVTCAPNNILYVVHSTTSDLNSNKTFMLARVSAATGAILSDTAINTLTGTDWPAWNALEYRNGKLYAVENSWRGGGSAEAKRGYVYEVGLSAGGDPISATVGAYIGGYPAPDGALAYRSGTWYASDWRDDAPHASSWIRTTTDIMNTGFTGTLHTEPKGYFDGWDFEADGDLLGVSWMASYGLNVFKIDLVTGNPTVLFNIGSQLPAHIISFSGLSAVIDPVFHSGFRLVQTQNVDGGWGWPLTGGSAMNTLGPIAQGLAKAYLVTRDPPMKVALQSAGTLLLSKTTNFSPGDGYLALQLDQVFGSDTYRAHVNANFYGPLAAGTYNRNGAGTLYSTASYINMIRTNRHSWGQGNMAAWDIGIGLVGAASCGASTSEWIAGVKAEINLLSGGDYYDVIGLAGALYGLAHVQAEFDPTSGMAAGSSNLREMANQLAGYQISSGGFTFLSTDVTAGYETNQETAYAILALAEVDAVAYQSVIAAAAAYLKSVQLPTGGWDNRVGDTYGENNELTGEAVWGIVVADSAMLMLNVTGASLYVRPGETVVVDLDVANLSQKVNACQAILGYDSTKLSVGTVAPGGGGVWDEVVIQNWLVAGEINTAVVVNASGNVGTDADGTVAKITVSAQGTAGVTEQTTRLVFLPDVSDVKSTFLSDLGGVAVWPTKVDSLNIFIDGVDPTISIVAVTENSQSLVGGGAVNAVVGTVNIAVSAADGFAGLDGPPAVTVTPNGSTPEPAVYVNESPDGTFNYTWAITSATANGLATISAAVSDLAGNPAGTTATFTINKHQVTGTVQLDGLNPPVGGLTRTVTFVATAGATRKTWNVPVSFAAGTSMGTFLLTDVPEGTSLLSAKTAWNLRRQVPVNYVDDRAVASFTGSALLLGGDLNGSNSINVLDYSLLRAKWMMGDAATDITGDGIVNNTDYTIMKLNWFMVGNAE